MDSGICLILSVIRLGQRRSYLLMRFIDFSVTTQQNVKIGLDDNEIIDLKLKVGYQSNHSYILVDTYMNFNVNSCLSEF